MCAARLGDSSGLVCTRADTHEEHKGCVYVGSSLTDKHDASDSAARQDEVQR
jgi:hypothetical protein